MTILAAILIVAIIAGPVLALVVLDRWTARTEPGFDWDQEG